MMTGIDFAKMPFMLVTEKKAKSEQYVSISPNFAGAASK